MNLFAICRGLSAGGSLVFARRLGSAEEVFVRLTAHARHYSHHRRVQQHHKLGPCLRRMRYICHLLRHPLVTPVAILVWRLPIWVVFLPALVFATVDSLYLSSALNKVPDGAWFALLISTLMTGMFLLWRFGKEIQWRAETENRFQPSTLVMKNGESKLALTLRWGGDILSSVSGFGIFFDKTGVLTRSVFTHFASKLGALPDVSVFFHLHPVETPSIPDEERYHISRFASIPLLRSRCPPWVYGRGRQPGLGCADLRAGAQVRRAPGSCKVRRGGLMFAARSPD
ncbi:potassium transporter [Ilyonectria robusta]